MAADSNTEVAVAGPGRIAVARDFLVDTRAEMDKVSWPPKDELIKATKAVLISALLLGILIGLVDKVLTIIFVDGLAALTK